MVVFSGVHEGSYGRKGRGKKKGGGGVDDLVYTPDLCTEFGIQSEKATRHSYIGSIF